MHFYEDPLQGGCGVSVLYEFTQEYYYYKKNPATIDYSLILVHDY